MYRNVLLAIDLSFEQSWSKALPSAIAAAQQAGGTLHLLMVVPDFGMSIVGSFFPQDYEKEALKHAYERLQEFAKEQVPEDVQTQVHVAHGRPYEEILQAAKRIPADLIVLGPYHPGAEDYFLGSTASRVVRFAPCTVLVARG